MKIGPREQALREMRERQLTQPRTVTVTRKAGPAIAIKRVGAIKKPPDDLEPVGAELPRGPKPKSGGAAARRR